MPVSELASKEIFLFVAFTIVVGLMFYADLFLVNRQARVVTIRSALLWSAIWIGAALLFNFSIYIGLGRKSALEFLTAYLIEKSLSVDNLFVFLVVFAYLGIAPMYQPRVLRWGILGAIVLRAFLIVIGVELVRVFHWVLLVFGVVLLLSAIQLARKGAETVEPGKNLVLRFLSRHIPMTTDLYAERFFVRIGRVLAATPLLAALVVIESTDLIFALDSIPAVLGVSNDLFIVYTSNVFAILGLRALYFAVAGAMQLFSYLKYSLAAILGFIGGKMLIHDLYEIPTEVALVVVFALLLLAVVTSVLFPANKSQPGAQAAVLSHLPGESKR